MSGDISLSYVDGITILDGDAILEQYQIALFTERTEFSSDPSFGFGLETFLAEINNEVSAKAIKQRIISYTAEQFPEIIIRGIQITVPQGNQINISLSITVIPYGLSTTLSKDIILG